MYEKIINNQKITLNALAQTLEHNYKEITFVYYTKYTMIIYIRNKKFTIDLQPILEYFKKDKTIYGLQRYTIATLKENGVELTINEESLKATYNLLKLLRKELDVSINFDKSILDIFSRSNHYIFALVKDNHGKIYECTYYIKDDKLLINKYQECDGRTKDELVSEGHAIMDEWCEDVIPTHNPWRTFDEIPADNPFLIVKIKKYVYRAAYYNKVNDTITTTKGSIPRKEAFAEGFKWKYVEDDEGE